MIPVIQSNKGQPRNNPAGRPARQHGVYNARSQDSAQAMIRTPQKRFTEKLSY
jgi:hypothetical protein